MAADLRSWLGSVSGDLYVTEVGLTSSHNSMAYSRRPGFISELLENHYLNQDGKNLYDQFMGGNRMFSLLTTVDNAKDWSDQFTFAHGAFEVGDRSDAAVKQLFEALANNQSEFINLSLGPYGGEGAFRNANPGLEFWDTRAAKRFHSIFFSDGNALKGTPRRWNDDIFNQWLPNLPEEQRAQLRGKPLVYVPQFGYNNPTIPKLKDLRGKFSFSDESWTNKRSYSSAELNKLSKSYAKDFPKGIKWDEDKYRLDSWYEGNLANIRGLNRDFVNRLIDKPRGWASFIGVYNSDFTNFGPFDGLRTPHRKLWFEDYVGDKGNPNFRNVVTKNDQLVRPLTIGKLSGVFFTDFVAGDGANEGTASIISNLQPRVDIVTGQPNHEVREGSTMTVKIETNIPGRKATEYGVAIKPLSKTFDAQDFNVTRGKSATISQVASRLSARANQQLAGGAFLVDPGPNATFAMTFADNDSSTEYFSLQAINKRTGELYGAPITYAVL